MDDGSGDNGGGGGGLRRSARLAGRSVSGSGDAPSPAPAPAPAPRPVDPRVAVRRQFVFLSTYPDGGARHAAALAASDLAASIAACGASPASRRQNVARAVLETPLGARSSRGHGCGLAQRERTRLRAAHVPNGLLLADVDPGGPRDRKYNVAWSGGAGDGVGGVGAPGDLLLVSGQDELVSVYDAAEVGRAPGPGGVRLLARVPAHGVRWTVSSFDTSPDGRLLAYSTLSPVLHLVQLAGIRGRQAEARAAIEEAARRCGSARGTGDRRSALGQ